MKFIVSLITSVMLLCFPAFAAETTVTFIWAGGAQEVQAQEGVELVLPNPETEGMTFLHWVKTGTEEVVDLSVPYTPDMGISFTAVYEAKEYKIYCNTAATVTREYGEEIGELPEPPEIPGKVFVAWYYDSDFSQEVNVTDKMPARDVTVYPYYETKDFTISFEGLDETIKVYYGDRISALPQGPAVEGKVFSHWEYNKKEVEKLDKYEWTTDIKLTPVYDPMTFAVSLPDGNVITVEYGETIGDLPTPAEKPGYTFVGYQDQNGEWVTEATKVTSTLRITYVWEGTEITITLKDDDWEDTISATAGLEVDNLPDRSKDGYRFQGWARYQNGTPTTGPFYGDTTLYASYKADLQDIYLVELDQTIQRETGTQVGSLPKPPNREGKEFIGWFNGDEEIKSSTEVPAGGWTLVARYDDIVIEPDNTVEIRYWSDGVKINTVDLPQGDVLLFPGPPALKNVDGRGFSHWSEREEGSAYTFGQRVSEDLDLYAVWK